jgi:general secretion pathway protein K
MKPAWESERGVALLAALIGIALMTIAVMDLTTTTVLGYRAAANQANELRADYLARSGVNVGLALLAKDSRKDAEAGTDSYDGLDEDWAKPYPPIPVGGGFASVSIVDENRKLDINQLVDPNGQPNPQYVKVIGTLFQLIGIPPNIIPAIIDWLDPDSIPSGSSGAEADYYMRLIPPYQPRNGPMPTIGDLKMIRGVDDQTFLKLSQFLTVYSYQASAAGAGVPPRININTAPIEVIESVAVLDPNLAGDVSKFKDIIKARAEQPFTPSNISDLGLDPQSGQIFRTDSDIFTLTGSGTYAGARKLVFATIYRLAFSERTLGRPPMAPVLLNWHED